MATTIDGPKVFLSYSRKDAGLVVKVELILRAAGTLPFLDTGAIQPGEPWRPTIIRSIAGCDRMMVFWCRHSTRSAEVASEYKRALSLGKRVVPVRLDRSLLARDLGDYQAIDISKLTWWSHEIFRWERISLLTGLLLLAIGGVYALVLA